MRIPALVGVLLLTMTSGCQDGVTQVSSAADSARIATERMAQASVARSNAKEQNVLEEALDRDAALNGDDGRFTSNYWIRRDATGWTVYHTQNGRAAILSGKAETGLSRANAEAALEALEREEAQGDAAASASRRRFH